MTRLTTPYSPNRPQMPTVPTQPANVTKNAAKLPISPCDAGDPASISYGGAAFLLANFPSRRYIISSPPLRQGRDLGPSLACNATRI